MAERHGSVGRQQKIRTPGARRSDEDVYRQITNRSVDDDMALRARRHSTLPAGGANLQRSQSGAAGFTVLTINLADIKWIRRIGKGDYGEVWLARHEGANRTMAVKRINKGLITDESRIAFLQEIRLLSSLRHANLVKVYGACDSPSRGLFLFVELCAGSWRERLDDAEPIPPRVLVSVLRGVAAGMAYLHDKGVVHRDLKAANVLLRAAKDELDDAYPVVSDMGLARHVAMDGKMTVRGTTWVMAPEMLRHGTYDAAVDIFSYGILIGESVTRLDAEDVPRTKRFLVDWDELRTEGAIALAAGARGRCYERLLSLAADCSVDEPSARPRFGVVVDRLRAHAAELAAEPADDETTSGAPGSRAVAAVAATVSAVTLEVDADALDAPVAADLSAAVPPDRAPGVLTRLAWLARSCCLCFWRERPQLASDASAAPPPSPLKPAAPTDKSGAPTASDAHLARISSFQKSALDQGDTFQMTLSVPAMRSSRAGEPESSESDA